MKHLKFSTPGTFWFGRFSVKRGQRQAIRISLFVIGVVFGYFIPIDDIEESRDIVGSSVLVIEIIGVFPHINSQDRSPLAFGYGHQGIVLIGGRAYAHFPTVMDTKPCPSRTKLGSGCFAKF